MEVVTLLLFVGAVWAVGAGILFLFHVKSEAPQHADRLALLPLDDNWSDPSRQPSTSPTQSTDKSL